MDDRALSHPSQILTNVNSFLPTHIQDGTFSFTDFIELWGEPEVCRILSAYKGDISVSMHCATENGWTDDRLQKEPFSKLCQVQMNPPEKLVGHSSGIISFVEYMKGLVVPASLKEILEPSDIVGNIRFSHPTLYVFPGGQGDAALFGINGFNMLIDGGFSRRSCFWDFSRHLDRLDAVLLTRLNHNSIGGLNSVLERKQMNQVYPQIGHFFGNFVDTKSSEEKKDSSTHSRSSKIPPLMVNLPQTGRRMFDNLRSLNLKAHPCYRHSVIEPINLYHKVGHGKLDMYVLNPSKDSKEVREFLSKWHTTDSKSFVQARMSVKVESGREASYPVLNLVSICALLVWQPDNPRDPITRILFPGSTPQQKIFDSLNKLKHLEFLKYPVCSAKTIAASHKSRSKSEKIVSEARHQFVTKTSGTTETIGTNGSRSHSAHRPPSLPRSHVISSSSGHGTHKYKSSSAKTETLAPTKESVDTNESGITTIIDEKGDKSGLKEKSKERRKFIAAKPLTDNKDVDRVKSASRHRRSAGLESSISKTSSSTTKAIEKRSTTASNGNAEKLASKTSTTAPKSKEILASKKLITSPTKKLTSALGTEKSTTRTTTSVGSALKTSSTNKYGIGKVKTSGSPPSTPPKSAKNATNIEHKQKTLANKTSGIRDTNKTTTTTVSKAKTTTTSNSNNKNLTTTNGTKGKAPTDGGAKMKPVGRRELISSTVDNKKSTSKDKLSKDTNTTSKMEDGLDKVVVAAVATTTALAAAGTAMALADTTREGEQQLSTTATTITQEENNMTQDNGNNNMFSATGTESSSALSSLDHISVTEEDEPIMESKGSNLTTTASENETISGSMGLAGYKDHPSETHTVTEEEDTTTGISPAPRDDQPDYQEEDEYLVVQKDESMDSLEFPGRDHVMTQSMIIYPDENETEETRQFEKLETNLGQDEEDKLRIDEISSEKGMEDELKNNNDMEIEIEVKKAITEESIMQDHLVEHKYPSNDDDNTTGTKDCIYSRGEEQILCSESILSSTQTKEELKDDKIGGDGKTWSYDERRGSEVNRRDRPESFDNDVREIGDIETSRESQFGSETKLDLQQTEELPLDAETGDILEAALGFSASTLITGRIQESSELVLPLESKDMSTENFSTGNMNETNNQDDQVNNDEGGSTPMNGKKELEFPGLDNSKEHQNLPEVMRSASGVSDTGFLSGEEVQPTLPVHEEHESIDKFPVMESASKESLLARESKESSPELFDKESNKLEQTAVAEKVVEQKQEVVVQSVPEQVVTALAPKEEYILASGKPLSVTSKVSKESIREVIRTPDEVAELPVHEEVEPGTYEADEYVNESVSSKGTDGEDEEDNFIQQDYEIKSGMKTDETEAEKVEIQKDNNFEAMEAKLEKGESKVNADSEMEPKILESNEGAAEQLIVHADVHVLETDAKAAVDESSSYMGQVEKVESSLMAQEETRLDTNLEGKQQDLNVEQMEPQIQSVDLASTLEEKYAEMEPKLEEVKPIDMMTTDHVFDSKEMIEKTAPDYLSQMETSDNDEPKEEKMEKKLDADMKGEKYSDNENFTQQPVETQEEPTEQLEHEPKMETGHLETPEHGMEKDGEIVSCDDAHLSEEKNNQMDSVKMKDEENLQVCEVGESNLDARLEKSGSEIQEGNENLAQVSGQIESKDEQMGISQDSTLIHEDSIKDSQKIESGEKENTMEMMNKMGPETKVEKAGLEIESGAEDMEAKEAEKEEMLELNQVDQEHEIQGKLFTFFFRSVR